MVLGRVAHIFEVQNPGFSWVMPLFSINFQHVQLVISLLVLSGLCEIVQLRDESLKYLYFICLWGSLTRMYESRAFARI